MLVLFKADEARICSQIFETGSISRTINQASHGRW